MVGRRHFGSISLWKRKARPIVQTDERHRVTYEPPFDQIMRPALQTASITWSASFDRRPGTLCRTTLLHKGKTSFEASVPNGPSRVSRTPAPTLKTTTPINPGASTRKSHQASWLLLVFTDYYNKRCRTSQPNKATTIKTISTHTHLIAVNREFLQN